MTAWGIESRRHRDWAPWPARCAFEPGPHSLATADIAERLMNPARAHVSGSVESRGFNPAVSDTLTGIHPQDYLGFARPASLLREDLPARFTQRHASQCKS